jgi:hypothetical protein
MDFHLTVTPEEAEILGRALNELPRRISDPLFIKLQQQILTQQKESMAPQTAIPMPATLDDES